MSEETVYAAADSFVDRLAQDVNYHASTDLIIDRYANSLVRFDASEIRSLTDTRPLLEAKLLLTVKGAYTLPTTFSVFPMEQDWNASSVTWFCADENIPGDGVEDCASPDGDWTLFGPDRPYDTDAGASVDVPSGTTSGSVIELDVTDDLVKMLSEGVDPSWIAFIQNQAFVAVHSMESTTVSARPRLVLSVAEDGYLPTVCPAPDLDGSRLTRVYDVAEHVFTGACPVQAAAVVSELVPERAAHLRGNVNGADGLPLSGVNVQILGHPEFGWTRTRTDGGWDLVINGGGPIIVEYSKTGHLPVQRSIEVPWNDYLVLDDVVLLPRQAQAGCLIVSGATGGLYPGPIETDPRGTRSLAAYLPGTPTMTITDGSGATVTDYCVCSVEYTVDRGGAASGQASMPGELPPTSGYTYAAELEMRELVSGNCGATIEDPSFSTPVFGYVKDFLGFTEGMVVPSGYYDQELGTWVPEADGRVVEVVVDGSGCGFDVNGDGVADTSIDGTTAHDVTAAEKSAFSSQCGVGQAFEVGDFVWRIPMSHFSPYDWNWPLAFADGILAPSCSADGGSGTNCGNTTGGSIIQCEDQTLGETVAVAGTPWALHYQSSRQRGRRVRYELDIPFGSVQLGAGTPIIPAEVWVEVQVAGHRYPRAVVPYSAGHYLFDAWDGTDVWGRILQGAQPVTVKVGYVYSVEYAGPTSGSGGAFAAPGGVSLGLSAGQSVLWQTIRTTLGGWDQGSVGGEPRGQGLGGWSLTPHHVYDATAGVLYRGDGTQLATRGLQPSIHTIFDGSASPLTSATGLAVAADGTVYFAAQNRHAIYRILPDGSVELFAGVEDSSGSTDAQRLSSKFYSPVDLAFTRSGDLLVLERDGSRLRRIRGDTVSTLLTSAELSSPRGMAVGPEGYVYIADHYNNRIFVWTPGGDTFTYAQDATHIYLPTAIAVADNGDVYVAVSELDGSRVRRVWSTGGPVADRVTTVAGGGTPGSFSGCEPRDVGDGGLATNAYLNVPRALALGPDGSLYIAEWTGQRIRRVRPDGVIETFAGVGRLDDGCTEIDPGDGSPATSASLEGPHDVLLAPNGHLLIADHNDHRIWAVRPAMSDAVVGESIIAEPDGSLVYRFDERGRHIRTEHGITGETLLTFGYVGASGLLDSVSVAGSSVGATIQRDASGLPTSITSNLGPVTVLGTDASGYLDSIEDPETRAHILAYSTAATEDGLLDSFTTPDGAEWTFDYVRGRLTEDTAPSSTGFEQRLTRFECGEAGYSCDSWVTSGWRVEHSFTGAPWQKWTVDVWNSGDAGQRRRSTLPSGARTVWDRGDLSGELEVTGGGRVPITLRAFAADGTLVEAGSAPDPRPGFGEYARATRIERPYSGMVTNVEHERTIAPVGAVTLDAITSMTDTITVNDTRTAGFTAVVDDSSSVCRVEYTMTTPLGYDTVVCTDAMGRVRSVDAPGRELRTVTYDPATGGVASVSEGSRLTEIWYQDTTSSPVQPWVRSVRMFDNGAELSRVEFARDDAGWILSADESAGASTFELGIGRDLRGRANKLILPHNEVHGQGFTDLGAMSVYEPPNVSTATQGGTLSIPFFDEAHRPEALQVRDGNGPVATLDYVYDPTHGHLARIDLPNGRSLTITRDTTTSPDTVSVDGRIEMMTLDGTTTDYKYDGHLLRGERWTGAVNGSVAREHSAFGELTLLRINGLNITYYHDDDGRLSDAGDLQIVTTLENAGTSTEHWSRDTDLGSVWTEAHWGRHGELDEYDAGHASVGTLYSYAVTDRDDFGREVQREEELSGQGLRTYGFQYDDGQRLENVTIGGVTAASYTYDLNGNRLSATYAGPWASRPDVATTVYDNQDRLIQYGETSTGDGIECHYEYNAAGQLEERDCGSGIETFDYDLLGNLLSVGLTNGNTIDYDVDALGRRVRRRLMNGSTVLEEQRWLYLDGLNPVAELDAGNNVVRLFVYGTRANVPDYMLDVATGEKYRFIVDPRGSLRAVVDDTGTIVQRTEYDPFGVILDHHVATGFERVPFGFAGGLYDPETKLVRFGARDYDPMIGRWTAKDPILFGGGSTNLYSYVNQDPINYVDPSGLVVDTLVDLGFVAYDIYQLANGCGSWGTLLLDGLGLLIPFVTGLGVIAGIGRRADDTFEIIDGVRRAKAADIAGQSTIRADVQVGGRTVGTMDIPIGQLRSPFKSTIDVSSSPAQSRRFRNIMDGTLGGDALPPITVQPGSRGPSIPDVDFE